MNNSEAGSVRNNYLVTYSLPNNLTWRHAIVLADSGMSAQKALERTWEGREGAAREGLLAVVVDVEEMRDVVYLVD